MSSKVTPTVQDETFEMGDSNSGGAVPSWRLREPTLLSPSPRSQTFAISPNMMPTDETVEVDHSNRYHRTMRTSRSRGPTPLTPDSPTFAISPMMMPTDKTFKVDDSNRYPDSMRTTSRCRRPLPQTPSPISPTFAIAPKMMPTDKTFPPSSWNPTLLTPSPDSQTFAVSPTDEQFEVDDSNRYQGTMRSLRFRQQTPPSPSPGPQTLIMPADKTFKMDDSNRQHSTTHSSSSWDPMLLTPSPRSQTFAISPTDTTSKMDDSNRYHGTMRVSRSQPTLLTESPRYLSFAISPKTPTTDETYEKDDSNIYSGAVGSRSRFRESTHLIPSPGLRDSQHKTFEPVIMKLPVMIGATLLTFALAIGLEVAILVSSKTNGFEVPQGIRKVERFIVSFFPTLLSMPFAFAWRELDWNLRWYQPYILLQKGNVVAKQSLLLDYVSLGPLFSLFRSIQYKHRIIFWSSLTGLLTYLFQPLTGAIFQIQQVQRNDTVTVIGTKSIDFPPDVYTLNGFLAAAGYVDASVVHRLGDPPFVDNGWATADVTFPQHLYLNGSLFANTSGIQSNVNCSNPSGEPVLTPGQGTSLILSSTSIDGCPHSLTFDPNVATTQYGVDPVPCPEDAASRNIQFQPVMFWYYRIRDYDGRQEVKTVFCNPFLVVAEVRIVANLDDKGLVSCQKIGNAPPDNNVTSAVQVGEVFNGLIFENALDPFIQARATAIRSIVPGAVFKATQLGILNGSQSAFDQPDGLLNLTRTLYTRHLSLSAKAAYFSDQNSTVPAVVLSLVPRLKIDDLPAHLLALALVTTGIIGVLLHIIHRRKRKRLLLAAPPGSIASVVALTAHSGFGERLLPYDDEHTLGKKLDGLRFRLDQRTGAILADDPFTKGAMVDEETILASPFLWAPTKEHSARESSSLLPLQAAGESLPWKRSWKPDGMSTLQQPSNKEYAP